MTRGLFGTTASGSSPRFSWCHATELSIKGILEAYMIFSHMFIINLSVGVIVETW